MMAIPTPNTKDTTNTGMKGAKIGSPTGDAKLVSMNTTRIVPTASKIPASVTISQIPDSNVLSTLCLALAF